MRQRETYCCWFATGMAMLGFLLSSPSFAENFPIGGHGWEGVTPVSDANDPVSAGQDILAAWYDVEDDYAYFRIDLAGAPQQSPGEYAGIYGIYLVTDGNGPEGDDWDIVPDTLDGIDYVLTSHFNQLGIPWEPPAFHFDFHAWNGSTFASTAMPEGDYSVDGNSGMTLEWRVSLSSLGDPQNLTWYAATHDSGSCAPTYDLVGPTTVPVPEPASAAMLLGLLASLTGLAWCRRS